MEDYQQKGFRFVDKYNKEDTLSWIDSWCLFAFFCLIYRKEVGNEEEDWVDSGGSSISNISY